MSVVPRRPGEHAVKATGAGPEQTARRPADPEPSGTVMASLGTFARSSLEGRFGTDTAAGVRAALLHYTRRLKTGRKPAEIPRWLRNPAELEDVERFELAVDPETWRLLQREAQNQGIATEQLVSHAVMVYLADLDAASTP